MVQAGEFDVSVPDLRCIPKWDIVQWLFVISQKMAAERKPKMYYGTSSCLFGIGCISKWPKTRLYYEKTSGSSNTTTTTAHSHPAFVSTRTSVASSVSFFQIQNRRKHATLGTSPLFCAKQNGCPMGTPHTPCLASTKHSSASLRIFGIFRDREMRLRMRRGR